MAQWHEDLISPEQARTLDGLFYQRVRRTPNGVAYCHYDREGKQWYALTWADVDCYTQDSFLSFLPLSQTVCP